MFTLSPLTIIIGVVVLAVVAVVFILGVRSEMKPPEKAGKEK